MGNSSVVEAKFRMFNFNALFNESDVYGERSILQATREELTCDSSFRQTFTGHRKWGCSNILIIFTSSFQVLVLEGVQIIGYLEYHWIKSYL